ncbi:MAG TPA: hypothetical protein VGN23_00530 [Verrucomicrobiae bacterium]|jgi:hypothetical protein
MSEDGTSEGVISKIELKELAELFDRFEFALDPFSVTAGEAETAFEGRVRKVFDERVSGIFPDVNFKTFRCRMKSLCREFLKRNNP